MATYGRYNSNPKRKYFNKNKVETYYSVLNERVETKRKLEIKYIYHCTCIKARRCIVADGVIKGGDTDLPSMSPLAGNTEVQGTWFSLSDHDLPRRSPYGSQIMLFGAYELMSYLVEVTDKGNLEPRLFFECAHCYGSTQYVRFLLVRISPPDETVLKWCEKSCKEIDLKNNPFFEYSGGKIWSRAYHMMTIDVLIVGDIHLQDMDHLPGWGKIGTSRRAGRDPFIGVR